MTQTQSNRPTNRSETNPPDQASAAAVYDRLLGYLEHNTGHTQLPLAPQPSIVGGVCQAGHDPDAVRKAIRAAISNGDIFRWRDSRDGRIYLGVDDVEALRTKIATHIERAASPNRELIGIANQRINHLQGDRDAE